MSIIFTISSREKVIKEERKGGVIPIATAGNAMKSIGNCLLWMPCNKQSGYLFHEMTAVIDAAL